MYLLVGWKQLMNLNTFCNFLFRSDSVKKNGVLHRLMLYSQVPPLHQICRPRFGTASYLLYIVGSYFRVRELGCIKEIISSLLHALRVFPGPSTYGTHDYGIPRSCERPHFHAMIASAGLVATLLHFSAHFAPARSPSDSDLFAPSFLFFL